MLGATLLDELNMLISMYLLYDEDDDEELEIQDDEELDDIKNLIDMS